ncbi:MAG: SRPBCC family protein [Bacteroidota bacterium]
MIKVLMILSVFLLLGLILAVMGHKHVHHEIMIAASPEEVWAVIIDTDLYAEWNPAITVKKGDLIEGETILYDFKQNEDKSYDILATVKEMKEGQLLNQVGGRVGLLTFDHKYMLESVKNSTKVTIHEEYRGIGVHFWDPAPLEVVYGQVNTALKRRIESR